MTNQSNDGGRPSTVLTPRVTCTLDNETLSKASGNLSRGIRRAVAKASSDKNPTQN